MAQEYTLYKVTSPMRWDQIAYLAYGRVELAHLIAEANPTTPKDSVIPEGTEIQIPIVSVPDIDSSLLPPWKQ